MRWMTRRAIPACLADIARQVTECRSTKETRVSDVMGDVGGDCDGHCLAVSALIAATPVLATAPPGGGGGGGTCCIIGDGGGGGTCIQGLTLVHFSAQPEPFPTLNTSPKRLKTPSTPSTPSTPALSTP